MLTAWSINTIGFRLLGVGVAIVRRQHRGRSRGQILMHWVRMLAALRLAEDGAAAASCERSV
jgi:hypothetical protein